MKKPRTSLFFILQAICLCGLSCKDNEDPAISPPDEVIAPLSGTRTQLTLDSLFLYARQVYLWYDALPGYAEFDPRNRYKHLNVAITAFRTELFDLSQFKINTATGSPFEAPLSGSNPRYSYIDQGTRVAGLSSKQVALSSTGAATAILHHAVINNDNRRVAYLVLGNFPRLEDCKDALDAAFAQFAQASCTDLIVDLRLNNGGYVETAGYVANLMAPGSLNGKIMFTEEYNSRMQHQQATILQYQPYLNANGEPVSYQGRAATMADVDYSKAANTVYFEKKGDLESVKALYFIVSPQTASAAELLISCMRPYFNLKLIGAKTYGKPVGFFPIRIDTWNVYLASFLISNATGWHDYFEGMEPDVPVALADNPVWGDQDETGLRTALDLINGAVAVRSATATRSNQVTPLPAPPVPLVSGHLKLLR